MEVEFTKNRIAIIGESEKGNYRKELSIVQWGKYKGKIDIRRWKHTDEKDIPCSGITLERSEAEKLAKELTAFLKADKQG